VLDAAEVGATWAKAAEASEPDDETLEVLHAVPRRNRQAQEMVSTEEFPI
jgi:hypothetical protein